MWSVVVIFLTIAMAEEEVRVVIAGDRDVLPGLVVAATTLMNSTKSKERISLTILTTRRDREVVDAVMKCAVEKVDTRVFNFPRMTIRAPGRLAAELNFARLFLADVFPEHSGKIVYLDADVVVEGDIVELHDNTTSHYAVAAVPRGHRRFRLAPSVSNNDEARRTLEERGVELLPAKRRLTTQLQDFNAGVLVVHLDNWRLSNLTRETMRWIELNGLVELYTRGSNPPLVLALADHFERLNPKWNCPAHPSGRTPHRNCQNPAILHLTGELKPWDSTSSKNANIDPRWSIHLTPHLDTCLVVPGFKTTSSHSVVFLSPVLTTICFFVVLIWWQRRRV